MWNNQDAAVAAAHSVDPDRWWTAFGAVIDRIAPRFSRYEPLRHAAGLMQYVRQGDTVVVWKLDRLGRNTLHILETVKALTDRGVTLISTTDGIDSTAVGRMMIGVLGSLAEFERELIKDRTALKRAVSRANGTRFGRRTKVADPAHVATARRMKADGHTARDVAKYLGVSRATFYRYLAEEAA